MKKFLLLFLFLALTMGAVLVILEWALRRIPNRYWAKAQYMEQHVDNIEVLIFGSSHAFMGIDAAVFGPNAYNLANVSQSLDYDCLLFEKYLPRCKNLKRVIVSISPFSFYSILSQSEPDLLKVYDETFGIQTTNIPWRDRIEVLNSSAGDKLFNYYFKNQDMVGVSPQGLSTQYSLQNKKATGWDNGIQRAKVHTYFGAPQGQTVAYLDKMARLCQAHNIELTLVTTPFMPSYVWHVDSIQWSQTIRTVDSLSVLYGIRYLNYFGDTTYSKNSDYFFDADHLTPQGAAAFSRSIIGTER